MISQWINNIPLDIIITKILVFLLLFSIYILAIFLFKKLKKKLYKNYKNSYDKEFKTNPAFIFIESILKLIFHFIFIILFLPIFGVKMSSIIALISAFGLALGIGLQDMLKELIAGVKILIVKPFQIGDYIKCNEIEGQVYGMTIFYTILIRDNSINILIPNRIVSEAIVYNYKAILKELVIPFFISSNITLLESIQEKLIQKLNDRLLEKKYYLDRVKNEFKPKLFLEEITETGNIKLVYMCWIEKKYIIEARSFLLRDIINILTEYFGQEWSPSKKNNNEYY